MKKSIKSIVHNVASDKLGQHELITVAVIIALVLCVIYIITKQSCL